MDDSPNSRLADASDSADETGVGPPPQTQRASTPKDKLSEKEARHLEARKLAERDEAIETSGTAWQRFVRRMRLPRRLKFTREGKFFVGITLGVGFAAINTGNNLLYLLLGLLLALIVVSSIMSELSLRNLTVVRRLPTRAQVGRAHVVEIEVFNHKQRVPSYAIEVEDLRAGLPADKRCFFLKVSPRSAQVAAYRRTPSRRGRDTHTGFRVATRFPFGLFEKSREIAASGELIIYPAVDPVSVQLQSGGRLAGGETSLGRGHGEEYLGLRAMRDGEDPRDIYWKKSALGQQVLRERARDARPELVLQLEVFAPDDVVLAEPDTAGDAGKLVASDRRKPRERKVESKETSEWIASFERRIREIASRGVAQVKHGAHVTVRTTAGEVIVANRQTGVDRMLRFLALVAARHRPRANPSPREHVEAAE